MATTVSMHIAAFTFILQQSLD